MMLLGQRNGFLVGLDGVKVHAGILLDRFHHGHALPVGEIDFLALVGDLQGAADLLGNGLHHLFDEVHHAVVVGVGLVQFDGGELGVVLGVHALIAEDTAHFVDAVHAAHDQTLEVKLRLNAQDHIHIQRIVVGQEGTGGSADLKRRQDGRFHFQEALAVQEAAQLPQNGAALDEGFLNVGVDDEVHIALTVTGFAVGQAMELFGQGQQALGEQRQLIDADRDLTHLGAEHFALAANDIADIQFFEGGIRLIAQQIALDENLDITLLIAQMGKACLTHNTLGHHTARQRDDLTGFGFGRQIGKLGFEVGRVSILGILGDDKGVMAGGTQVGQLLAADSRLLGQILLGLGLVLLHGRSSFLFLMQTGAGIPRPCLVLLRARNGQHLVNNDVAVGQGNVDFVTGFVADQRSTHRALIADAVEVHIGLGGTGDVVFFGIFRIIALGEDLDAHTDGNGVVGQLAVIDDTGHFQGSFQVGDAGLHNGLLLLGSIILGIFAQVAVAARDLDLIRHFLTFDGAQFVQILFQLLVTLTGNDDFFSHARFS